MQWKVLANFDDRVIEEGEGKGKSLQELIKLEADKAQRYEKDEEEYKDSEDDEKEEIGTEGEEEESDEEAGGIQLRKAGKKNQIKQKDEYDFGEKDEEQENSDENVFD